MVNPAVERAGLSPHTRGSPSLMAGEKITIGSIPAHAGEPVWIVLAGDGSGVYPRTRGGA